MSEETTLPNRPFYDWLEDVRRIAEHNNDKIGHIPFWWECYRRNYSPAGAHSYNLEGMTINVPKNIRGEEVPSFREKPFPADPSPDIMVDLGFL